MSSDNFGSRFLTEFSDFTRNEIEAGYSVLRRRAARVLLGVPWQFIPYETCERRAVVDLHKLLLLCCCLDCIYDENSGAAPGRVSTEEIYLAWTAAGCESWLKRITLNKLRERANLDVLRQHPDLLVGAIESRLQE